MHIRVKISLIFTMIIFFLFSLLCGVLYYFSYQNRLVNIRTQLTNRAFTTANMLKQPEKYSQSLMNSIDSTSVLAIKNKTVEAFDLSNKRIYSYSDNVADTIHLSREILEKTRNVGILYFDANGRDVISYYDKNTNVMVISAAYDKLGHKSLERFGIILSFCLISSTLVAFTLGYLFSKALLRPIKKIAHEVKTISAQNLTYRMNSGNADDEWNYLTETLNELLNRLQESFEIQRRFISAVSHELSTPLTSISSQLEVSLQRDREAESYRAVMTSAYQDVRHLSKLTQTLLEFATISGSTGGMELNLIRIDEILMRLPGEITKLDMNYSVKIDFVQLPENEAKLLVFGNAELLFTAIKNVVTNACKYSNNRLAKIELSVIDTDIIIAIEDNGKGIAENELKNIFQPFYRTEDSRATVGFGVGLPLVNRIVKLHKGHIKVKSAVGNGTTFFIMLPVAGKHLN